MSRTAPRMLPEASLGQRWWLAALAIAVLIVGTAVSRFASQESRPDRELKSQTSPSQNPHVPPVSSVAPQASGETSTAGDQAERETSRSDAMTYASVAQNPLYWLGKARSGDAAAAVAVYQIFRRCEKELSRSRAAQTQGDASSSPPSSLQPHCANFPTGVDFLALLEPVAAAGDPIARIHFATEVLGSNADATRRQDLSAEQRGLMQRAIGYLEEEGTRGSVVALMQLAQAYESGAAGERNAERAHAYLLAIQALAPQVFETVTEDKARLQGALSEQQVRASAKRSRDIVKSVERNSASKAVRRNQDDRASSAVPPL